jgi:hypothetical protein
MAAHLQAMQREKTHLFFTTALYYYSLLLLFTTDMAAHFQDAQREKTQLSDKLSEVLALLQVLDLLALLVHALLVQKCKYRRYALSAAGEGKRARRNGGAVGGQV